MGDQHEPNVPTLTPAAKAGRWAIGGGLAAILYALFGWGTPTPAPSMHVFDVVLCADGPDEQHGATFACTQRVAGRVSYELTAEQFKASETDTAGYVTFAAPPVPSPTRLQLDAAGYETRIVQGFRFETCTEGCHNVYRLTSLTPPPPPLSHAGESGWLSIDGLAIRDDHGQEWRARDFTDFKLLYRFVHGEDIQPILTERIAFGANTLRVLMAAGALFDLPYSAYTDEQLDAFLDLLASRGLRCECVVLVDSNPDRPEYAWATATAPTAVLQRAALSRLAAVFERHWNVIGELCNECSHKITNVHREDFTKPAMRNLWERGSGQADEPPFSPPWDLVGDHPGRQHDWVRRLPCRDIRMAPEVGKAWQLHVSCIENEIMGAAEVVEDPGRRANEPEDFWQAGASAAANSNGAAFHCDGCIYSTVLGEGKQAGAARAFFAGMRFFPVNAPSWPYQRGAREGGAGVGHMPMEHADRYEDDSKTVRDQSGAMRTFCKGNGTTEWCVAVRPGPQWTARGRDGWHVVDEPLRGLVRLER